MWDAISMKSIHVLSVSNSNLSKLHFMQGFPGFEIVFTLITMGRGAVQWIFQVPVKGGR